MKKLTTPEEKKQYNYATSSRESLVILQENLNILQIKIEKGENSSTNIHMLRLENSILKRQLALMKKITTGD